MPTVDDSSAGLGAAALASLTDFELAEVAAGVCADGEPN